jgi:hypothetical protein
MKYSNTLILLINVYMPVDNSAERNTHDFICKLPAVKCLIDRFPGSFVILGGDSSVDFSQNSLNAELVSEYLNRKEVSLKIAENGQAGGHEHFMTGASLAWVFSFCARSWLRFAVYVYVLSAVQTFCEIVIPYNCTALF